MIPNKKYQHKYPVKEEWMKYVNQDIAFRFPEENKIAYHREGRPGFNLELLSAIDRLLVSLQENYIGWMDSVRTRNGSDVELRAKQVEKYCNGINILPGNKYVRIMIEGSVWGFIVIEHELDKKFKYGDILKAASLKQPTTNFARGNVFEGKPSYGSKYPDYKPNWTGAQ